MVCWGVWKARNELVWNNIYSRAGNVVCKANAYLSQWRSVQYLGSSGSATSVNRTDVCERWSKPDKNCVKVNCDATTFVEFSKFGVGWIARDDKGMMLVAARARSFPGMVDPQCAEAIGIREALSWINKQGEEVGTGEDAQTSFVLESDCQTVVGFINEARSMLSPVGVVISDCVNLLQSLKNTNVQFVKRSGNKAADFLARYSCFNPDGIASGGFVPVELQDILLADLS